MFLLFAITGIILVTVLPPRQLFTPMCARKADLTDLPSTEQRKTS